MKGAYNGYYVLLLTGLIFLFSCTHSGEQAGTADIPEIFLRPGLKELTEQIQKSPQNASLYYNRGNALHRLQEDSLALDDFKMAISLDSTQAAYYSAIGDLLFEHKDISGSIPWFQKAVAINPDDPQSHLKFAKMLIYTKEYTKAFNTINTVLRQDVYNPEGYFLKGMIYKDMNDTAKAISSFQTALNVMPDYKDAIIQLGQIYALQSNPIALQYYTNAFRLDTGDVFPLFAKGVFHQQQGQPEQAKEQYRECIRRDHQYADAYYNMGFLYLEQDSIDKAWRHFDLLTRISPTDAEAYYHRGVCNELLEKKQDAAADFRQALVFDKDYPEAQEALKRVMSDEL